MKRIRIAIQVAIWVVAFAGYVTAASHCAFEAAAAPDGSMASSHEGCGDHQSNGEKGKEEGIDCCKAFPPASVTAVKTLEAFAADSFAIQTYAALILPIQNRPQTELRPLELDTGPPFASSFVESVLQRSILAHAPPLSA